MRILALLLPLLAVAQTVEKDVVYSPGSRLMMNIARPAGSGLHPAIVAVHGPDFASGSRVATISQ